MAGSQSLKKQGLWANWSSPSETFRGLSTQLLKSISLLVSLSLCTLCLPYRRHPGSDTDTESVIICLSPVSLLAPALSPKPTYLLPIFTIAHRENLSPDLVFPRLARSSNPRFFIHPLSHVPQHLERVASFRRTRRLQASWLGPSIGYIVALKYNISQDSTNSSILSRLAINLQ
ncbi:Serine/threonine-protein kinase ATG1 [Fusarium oxysporum f. sp. albedinis]|nr:Serine/threonine-protein kinase ATG1 [Fusarium oxysporum f. sp. albedinis]